MAVQFGYSKSGLPTQKIRDLDWATPRPPLPKRALPEDVRQKIGLSSDPANAASAELHLQRPPAAPKATSAALTTKQSNVSGNAPAAAKPAEKPRRMRM